MVLEPKKSYTFSEIFELNASIENILSDLGYGYQSQKLNLARYPLDSDSIQQFQAKLYRRLPNIKFTSRTPDRSGIWDINASFTGQYRLSSPRQTTGDCPRSQK